MTESERRQLSDTLWLYLRGDMAAAEFERGVYREPRMEEFLGAALYLEVISTGFRSQTELDTLNRALLGLAEKACAGYCRCARMRDKTVLPMLHHDDFFQSLEVQKQRANPIEIHAKRCRDCGQWWLVAEEFQVHDNYHVRRLDGEAVRRIVEQDVWPTDYDKLAALLTEAREAKKCCPAYDVDRSSLDWDMRRLAIGEPGITISRLAWLLNMDYDVGVYLATKVVNKWNVDIDFEGNARPHPAYGWWNSLREFLSQRVCDWWKKKAR